MRRGADDRRPRRGRFWAGSSDMNISAMTKQKKPPPAAAKSRPTDAAFDVWLNRGLHEMFDNVANEPIADELLRLIEDDEQK